MSFDSSNSTASWGSTISANDNSQLTTKNVGVGMYPSLMGSFNIAAPILDIGSMFDSDSSSSSLLPFHAMYLDDPPTLSSPRTLDKDLRPTNMEMSLSVMEVSY